MALPFPKFLLLDVAFQFGTTQNTQLPYNDFMIERSAKVAENTTLRKRRELDMLFERRYEDNVSGKIDDVRFAKMSKRYEQEQSENAKKIKALRLELKKDESKRMDIDDFLETVRR